MKAAGPLLISKTMNEFLRFVVGALIDRPDELVIREDERGGVTHFLLLLPQSEVGKVIGKQGATIRALRNLLAMAADRQHRRVTLEIFEEAA